MGVGAKARATENTGTGAMTDLTSVSGQSLHDDQPAAYPPFPFPFPFPALTTPNFQIKPPA